VLRVLFSATVAVAVALLLFAWIPADNYQPIRPGERGTVAEGVAAVRRLPQGDAPLYSQQAHPVPGPPAQDVTTPTPTPTPEPAATASTATTLGTPSSSPTTTTTPATSSSTTTTSTTTSTTTTTPAN
jgi:hypothetical protein